MDILEQAVVGIDIGGTTTTIGIVTRLGEICWKTTFMTSGRDLDNYLFKLVKEIERAKEELTNQVSIAGIGVGVPGGNYLKGTVQAANLNWGEEVNFVQALASRYHLPIVLDNDANAAAIGEMHFGAARGLKNFVLITLGTGLGSGIIVNGQLMYGHEGLAGELGHICVEIDGRDCACGLKGCLETYVSANGIKRTVFELLARRTVFSPLREVSYADMTAQMISENAEAGDPVAKEAFDLTGKILSLKLADAIAFTNPEAIILFGGLSNAGELLFEPTRNYLKGYILSIYNANIPILPSSLPGSDAAVLGAASLAWQKLKNLNEPVLNPMRINAVITKKGKSMLG